jgi:hypothetical protein
MSSGSHSSLFHTPRAFLTKVLQLELELESNS